MASFIGKTISLISQSDIRYRGILHSIDATQATIQLSNVYSMGTETRRPPAEYIPPHLTPYEFILFQAQQVKDLTVDQEPLPAPPVLNVHNDPAIIGVSQANSNTHGSFGAIPTQPAAAPASVPVPGNAVGDQSAPATSQKRRDANGRQNNHGANSIRSAATSMENVERAMGDLRVSGGSKGRRGDEIQAGNIQVPATDFDFASANAKFDKTALAKPADSDSDSDSDVTTPEDTETKDRNEKKEKEKTKESAYNPSRSFFDSLTPNSVPRGNSIRGGGGRGRGRGRSRREEEAQRNLMTFGEAIPPSSANGLGRRGGRRGGGGGSGSGYNPQSGTSRRSHINS